MKRILIAEDEINTAKGLTELLGMWGYGVCGPVQSGREALALAESEHPDAVLMDIRMRGKMDGIEAGKIISARLGIPVIIMTAYFDKIDELQKNEKQMQYIDKPFDLAKLRALIENCLSG
ncbi:MAG: response regulator [Actinomycetota bacterium]|nr:response regulator [Actinomycetota bacterium]